MNGIHQWIGAGLRDLARWWKRGASLSHRTTDQYSTMIYAYAVKLRVERSAKAVNFFAVGSVGEKIVKTEPAVSKNVFMQTRNRWKF